MKLLSIQQINNIILKFNELNVSFASQTFTFTAQFDDKIITKYKVMQESSITYSYL